jgi:hypothetical protein
MKDFILDSQLNRDAHERPNAILDTLDFQAFHLCS